MSIELMAAVFYLDIPPGLKLLILALADNANDSGHAWPSQATLGLKTSQTERSIRTQTRLLQVDGWVDITQAPGRGHSIHYFLNVQKIQAQARIRKAEVGAQKAEKAEVGAQKAEVGAQKAEVASARIIIEPSLESKDKKSPIIPFFKGDTTPIKRKLETKQQPKVSEGFIARMIQEYSEIWAEQRVHESIALALAHKAAKNYTNTELYVKAWLRRDAESRRQNNGTKISQRISTIDPQAYIDAYQRTPDLEDEQDQL